MYSGIFWKNAPMKSYRIGANGYGTKVSEETEPVGATPGFDASELLLSHLTNRELLNAAELDAVDQAYNKYVYRPRKKRRGAEWLTEPFIREVHVAMFSSIWGWAGKYRDKPVNIRAPVLLPD
jgi:fido (protein-threonine AMPylation protein)